MKNVILMVALLFCVKAFSQTFEGTIKWSMKAEITDPKQKAQMEAAQKQMSDPANQARMKEMQAKMNDPQFKAMMESNPQLKAQMDKMMGSMASGDMSSIMPKGFIVKIKGKNTLTKMDGGMMANSEFLHQGDKNQSYSVDRQNKTYSVMNATQAKTESTTTDADVKVTKTSETAKILNYNCTKYIVETTSHGTTITQFLWATTEIKDFDLKALSKQNFGKGQRMFYDKVDGVPLKIEMKTNEMNMTMEATEIKKESLSAADFTIPADFKEVPGMFK